MSHGTPPFLRLVENVERRLANFYDFVPRGSAIDHLVNKDELKASFGDSVVGLPEFQARGGVFLQKSAHDDLFIGIHLDESVTANLVSADPRDRLDEHNLDAFCILIEEVSHFHLILNRALGDQTVSKLELEWQGEVDKLLVCAIELKEQYGDSHVEPLARKLYDGATIVAANAELYWEATRHAARFWRAAERRGEPLGAEIRAALRRSYRSTWREKLVEIEAQRRAS